MLAALVTFVLTGAIVLLQVQATIREHTEQNYVGRVERARAQANAALQSLTSVAHGSAILLANQPEFVDAVQAADVEEVIRRATLIGEQIPTALVGAPGLALYDARGTLLVRTNTALGSTNGATPPAVREVLARDSTLSGLRRDPRLGLAAYGVAPMRDRSGTVIGALEVLAGVNDAFAQDTARLSGTHVVFFDDLPLASSDPTVRFEPARLSEADEARLESTVDYLDFGAGRQYLSSVLTIRDREGNRVAHAYVGVDRRTVRAAANAASRRVITAVVGAGVIGLALSAMLTALAVRPLSGLVRAAQGIRANELDRPVPVSGPRETRQLGAALEEMRRAIRQAREALLSTNLRLEEQVSASAADLTETTMDLAVIDSVMSQIGHGSRAGIAAAPETLTRLTWVDGAVVALAAPGETLDVIGISMLSHAAADLLVQDVRRTLRSAPDEVLWVQRTAQSYPELDALGIRAFAAMPMRTPTGIAGAIAVTSTLEMAATPGRRQLLDTIARELTSALELHELADEADESRRIAESVLREMSEGVLLLDHEGICRVCNPAAARLLGVERRAAVGRSARRLLPALADHLDELRTAAPERQRVAGYTIELGGRAVAVTIGPFHDPDEIRGGMILLLRDLSAETEAERAKRDFVSMVGHELRTPLTLIRASIDLLHEPDAGSLNATQKRIVEVLQGNVARLMTLITDLLDMSALDSGRMEIEPELIDLRNVVGESAEAARPSADAKGITISTQLPSEPTTAWADASRIAQVLANLLSNAVKYTPGGGHVTLRVAEDVDGVRVEVSDTGIGVAAEDLERVFEKFFRTAAGRRATGGTGLGLAIARSIVERHGGRIWCESAGNGSTFTFVLPARRTGA